MPITVTKPSLPPLDKYIPYLKQIWKSGWITNQGPFHEQFEKALAEYLGVKYVSLFANGTLALIAALKALDIRGEVITTPYSFVATAHSLWWNHIQPVFADIEEETLTLDVSKVEAAITPDTSAIMPVHVYGYPCQTEKLKMIAEKYGLKIVYDAAHAFGVKQDGKSLLDSGDLSVLSFHATKVFNTIEGGAVVCHNEKMKHHIDNLKNFGFRDETIVEEPGINGKMNEIQAAYGILQLEYADEYIAKRKRIVETYRENLDGVSGIRFLPVIEGLHYNYAYFPVFIKHDQFGSTRDEVYERLKQNGIYGRRYFYPLISEMPFYHSLKSSGSENLPIASKASLEVICLPLYPDLDLSTVKKIADLIKSFLR